MATLGFTGVGGNDQNGPICWAGSLTMPEDGVVQSLTIRSDNSGGSERKIRLAIYDEDSDAADPGAASLIEDLGELIENIAAPAWFTLDSTTNPTLTNGQDFWIVAKFPYGSWQCRYSTTLDVFDARASTTALDETTSVAFPDPMTDSGWASMSKKPSFYMTYDLPASGGDGRPVPRGIGRGIMRGAIGFINGEKFTRKWWQHVPWRRRKGLIWVPEVAW